MSQNTRSNMRNHREYEVSLIDHKRTHPLVPVLETPPPVLQPESSTRIAPILRSWSEREKSNCSKSLTLIEERKVNCSKSSTSVKERKANCSKSQISVRGSKENCSKSLTSIGESKVNCSNSLTLVRESKIKLLQISDLS